MTLRFRKTPEIAFVVDTKITYAAKKYRSSTPPGSIKK
jgi:ribosome-binding factor A